MERIIILLLQKNPSVLNYTQFAQKWMICNLDSVYSVYSVVQLNNSYITPNVYLSYSKEKIKKVFDCWINCLKCCWIIV